MFGETIKIGRNKTVNILKQFRNLGGSFHGKKECLVVFEQCDTYFWKDFQGSKSLTTIHFPINTPQRRVKKD